jgi:hypothetical protein
MTDKTTEQSGAGEVDLDWLCAYLRDNDCPTQHGNAGLQAMWTVRQLAANAIDSLRSQLDSVRKERDEALDDKARYIDYWKAAEQRARDVREWIPVSERLPDDNTKVIVHGGIAYIRKGEWFTLTGERFPGKPIQWPVTHWMPLPEPPAIRSGE